MTKLSFLIPGNYAEADPHTGLEATLRIIELCEQLGYDGGWVRQRHLEHGISSAAVFLAAASQRTKRIELGTAVIQIGHESPFRLGEDLAMVDALSGGRLNVGLSAGPPQHLDLLGPLVFDGDHHVMRSLRTRAAMWLVRGRMLLLPDGVQRLPVRSANSHPW